MHTARLSSPTDLPGFRQAARVLLAQGVPPGAVGWRVGDERDLADEERTPDLYGIVNGVTTGHAAAAPRVPAFFAELCQAVCLHRDPARWALLYRLLWRLQHEPGLRQDPLDADRLRAEHMARAVRRDMHKMKAFVRFRPVGAVPGQPEQGSLHVAWFEPDHHVVEAVAPFFARRFAQMRWAILTPLASVRWDGRALTYGPGARREEAPQADAGEALWLTYYASIFNPARLKLAMMRKEMPRRYWHNLPEAVLIQPLTQAAAARSGSMVEQEPVVPERRMPRFAPPVATVADPTARASLREPRSCATLAALSEAMQSCRACPIGECATQAVAGEGPGGARLMFVGEQPGDQEDLRGRPFVGPAGALFDRALQQLGISRDAVYVTNAVKHFKYELRGKRRIHKTPAQQEAAACIDWLEREIELVRPQALVALGATAARSLMRRTVPVMRERGQWLHRPGDGLPVLVTLHPSALLRMEADPRQQAWLDWLRDLALAAAPR